MQQLAMRQTTAWATPGSIIVDVPVKSQAPAGPLPGDSPKFSWVKNNWPVILAIALIVISVPDLEVAKK